MVWTAPRTWTDGEVVTAAMVNAHLRDNLNVLKTTRDSAGRISALSAATLADLSGANLTGVAKPGSGNSFTAGTTTVGGTARFILPVGTDKWTGTKGVDARGAWVEGDYLHHIALDHTTEWRYLGSVVATPAGARPGSAWVEGDELHYIDASGVERRCVFAGAATVHTDAGAIAGSAWVETYAHWIRETGGQEIQGHADITHADHSDHSDHSDHGDTGPHTDHEDHSDVTTSPHVDHTDHSDHTDGPGHGDFTHADHTDHSDHEDHGDSGVHDDHTDHNDGTPHDDIAADSRPVVVS